MIKAKTIVAVATPSGIGALAILRLSGNKAFQIFSEIIIEKEKFINCPTRFIKQYLILNPKSKEIIDEVTAIKYKNPHSFTGEDIVEIISHGGVFTVKTILKLIIGHGGEIAERGEFSKRAFLNGKIDLMKAEAIKAIIDSKSEDEYSSAINLYNGLYQKLFEWNEQIQQEITLCEAEIEFGEEESISTHDEKVIIEIKNKISQELTKQKFFKDIKNGLNIVIGGPANAGKSSLFNFIVGYKRAIVHNQPGTTRDSINAKIEVCGNEVNLYDTAGFRSSIDPIENEGIRISKELLFKAHLILWITDISEDVSTEELDILKSINKQKILLILNKTDKNINHSKVSILHKISKKTIQISIEKNSNLKEMMQSIQKSILEIFSKNRPPDIFINDRQISIANKIFSALEKAVQNWDHKEIVSYYLKDSLKFFEEINGKVDNDKIINVIFSTFCIGK